MITTGQVFNTTQYGAIRVTKVSDARISYNWRMSNGKIETNCVGHKRFAKTISRG